MRTTKAFVLGTITGAAVVWLWGREIGDYVGQETRGVRAKAADGMQAVEERTGDVLERGRSSLRRAEDFVRDTRAHVSEALRAGQEAIRPAPPAGDA